MTIRTRGLAITLLSLLVLLVDGCLAPWTGITPASVGVRGTISGPVGRAALEGGHDGAVPSPRASVVLAAGRARAMALPSIPVAHGSIVPDRSVPLGQPSLSTRWVAEPIVRRPIHTVGRDDPQDSAHGRIAGASSQRLVGITVPSGRYVVMNAPDRQLGEQARSGGFAPRGTRTAGGITEYPIPATNSAPIAIANGPDGNLWFVEQRGNNIGRIAPSTGAIIEFPIPYSDPTYHTSYPQGITAGPDGNLWFTEAYGDRIGRITPAGAISEFGVPFGYPGYRYSPGPEGIAAGADGNLWFTMLSGNAVGRVTPTGAVTVFHLPTGSPGYATSNDPAGITAGPDGNLWFIETRSNKIASLDPATLNLTEFPIPTPGSFPLGYSNDFGITTGPDGNLWFVEPGSDQIGRLTLATCVSAASCPIAEFPVAADDTGVGPLQITAGGDGNLYFTEPDQIGRITPAGVASYIPLPTLPAGAQSLVEGPDGNLWVTETGPNSIAAVALGLPPVMPVRMISGPKRYELGSKSLLYRSPCAGDPVDCASGEFTHSFTDLPIPGRGLALNFVRTYKAFNAAQDGPLGHGWTDSYAMGLTTDASGTITVTEEGGTAVTFALSGTTYAPPSRVLASLVANGDGTLTFSRTDQTHYTFSAPTTGAAGHLLSETDRNGYATTLGYTGGQLTTITDPAGRSLTLSYSGARISGIVDPIGRTVAFTYNAAGDLTDAMDVRGHVTHFTYDPATHLLLTMTDPRGGVVSNVYDTSNRVVQQTDAMGRTTTFTYTMDATGAQTTTITDPRGYQMVEIFQNNLLVARTRGYGTSQAATWTYTYDPTTLGTTTMTDPNGHTRRYTYDANGNMTSETDPLSRTTTYAYDALNDTTAITDALGVTTAMTYDASDNLLRTTRPLTQTGEISTTMLAYDPQRPGDLVARTDPNGHTEHFTYDAYGDLATASDALSETLSYRYDPVGRMIALTRPDGNVTGSNPISYTTTFTYDAIGDTTAITDARGHVLTHEYDADNNVITTTDTLGRQTVNSYDLANEKTSERRADGGIYLTNYDPAGNVSSQSDPLGHTTTYVYDPLDRLSAVTDPLGHTTTYAYDPAGHPITKTDALGRSTITQYDAANERTSVTAPDNGVLLAAYDGDGRVISTTDALSRTTLYSYDSLNQRTAVIDPLGRVTTVGYDIAGNVITATDAMTRATVTTYDAVNRPTLVMRPDGSTLSTAYDADGQVISTTNALSHTTLYAYDVLDQRVSTTDPLGHTTRYRYDSVGNRVAVIDPLTHTIAYGYDALNRVITTTDALRHTTLDTYDLAGNHTTTTDAQGHTTVYGYDAANRQTSVVQPDGSILRSGYDPAGGVISSTDALGRPTLYGYDAAGHVISTTDALSRTTLATYDLAGHRTTFTDALGRTTSYGYDADDEPITATYSDGTTPNVLYTYYPSGQRRSMTDGTGTTTYGYDMLDRPITVTTGAGRQVGYGYDLAGDLTRITYPDGSAITRTYDAANRFTAVIDPRGRTTGFAYDAADNLITTAYPTTTTPITTALGYDAANQITGAVTLSPRATLLRFGYTRNALGQVTGGTDSIDGPAHQYAYNSLNQLTSDQQGTGAVTTTTGWSPDAAGEITQTINGLRGYTATLTYDTASELTSMGTTSPSTSTTTTTTYAYDGDGHRTGASVAPSGASTMYGWDQADRLVTATVTASSGIQRGTTYSYDGDGLRVRKTVAGTGEDYTWDTSGSLPLLLQDGAARYIDGPDGLPVEMISGTTTLYLLHDQLGSTRGVLNGAGHLIASYAYDAYGNVKVHYGTIRSVPAPYYTPFLYAGQYTDAETGLQFLQARYYDPATAQFLSRDPLASITNQPYTYTGSDPLNGSDPTGQCDVSVPFAGNVHVPGTSDNHYLCTTVAEYKVLTALSNFDNSDLSNTVYNGVTGILHGAAACAGNIEACAQGTLLLTEYIATHPTEVLAAAAQAGVSSLATLRDEIACGHYGAAAGHLLLAFVSTFGPGKVFDALKGAAVAGDAAGASEGFFSRLAGRTADVVGCTPCFAAGTLVATPQGERAIETLHAGDQILAEDPQTKHVEAEALVAVRQNPATMLVAVDLSDGSVITTTPTHAFWVDAGPGFAGPGWLYAEHLHPGDQLRTADGARVFVVGTRRNVGRAIVYTLTVAKDHTFFVGTARVLVHNSDCPGLGLPRGTIRKLSPGQIKALKQAGHDIHQEKGRGRVAQFDLYQDENGWIYQMLKGGKGEPEPLGINIKDVMGL